MERMFEIALKLNNSDSAFERSLSENSLSFLISEEISKDDIESLKSATNAVELSIKQIQSVIGTNLPSVATYLKSMSINIGKSKEFIAKLDMENPEGVINTVKRFFGAKVDANAALQSVLQLQAKAKQVTDILEGSLEKITSHLSGILSDKGDDIVKKSLRSIEGTDNIPDEATIKSGIMKALKASKPGMIGKLVNFLKGSTANSELLQGIGDLDGEALSNDIMELSYEQISAIKDGMEKAPDVKVPPQDVTRQIAKPDSNQSDNSEESTSPPGGEANPEEDQEAEAAADTAADKASKSSANPTVGAKYIVDQWASAGKTLNRNVSQKQRGNLSKALGDVFDAASSKLRDDVESAVDGWRNAQKVLQSPNVSDKQINSLKSNLSDFVASIITSESYDPRQLVRSCHKKMAKYLIENAAYTKDIILEWKHKTLVHNFVNSYCDIEILGTPHEGILQEHLIDPYTDDVYDEDELIQSHWARIAGIKG